MNLAPITVVGNLTSEPELTYTSTNQARLSFSVAVNHVWYDQAGEKQEKVSYVNITAWRYLAENSARTLEKGIGVMVYGRLEQRSYEKDGEKKSITEIVAEEIGILTRSLETITRKTGGNSAGGASQGGNSRQASAGQRRQRPAMAPAGGSLITEDDTEPF